VAFWLAGHLVNLAHNPKAQLRIDYIDSSTAPETSFLICR
ncbi:unnamed protein product, partial [Acidithrix sp. C25]